MPPVSMNQLHNVSVSLATLAVATLVYLWSNARVHATRLQASTVYWRVGG